MRIAVSVSSPEGGGWKVGKSAVDEGLRWCGMAMMEGRLTMEQKEALARGESIVVEVAPSSSGSSS